MKATKVDGGELMVDELARGDARPTGTARGDARPTGIAARGDARPTLRLPPPDTTPPEKRTFRQIETAQREHQAFIGLESTVRQIARELGLEAKAADALAKTAWGGFRIVNGEPIPVEADRQTVLLAADGNVMSVADWVAKQVRSARGQVRGGSGGQETEVSIQNSVFRSSEADDEVLPRRNPFRRKTWNLTEQMQLRRRDPILARRLKAEAWAEGD